MNTPNKSFKNWSKLHSNLIALFENQNIKGLFILEICSTVDKFQNWTKHFIEVWKVLVQFKPYCHKINHVFLHHGNTGCGVSYLGIQNPIVFCLKVKCSKEFFDIF